MLIALIVTIAAIRVSAPTWPAATPRGQAGWGRSEAETLKAG